MDNKKRRSGFFEKIFLLDDISIDIALGISFFTLNNVKINFIGYYIYLKIYTIAKILLTIKQVELIRKKKFATVAFDLKDEIFILYIAFINQDSDVHPSWTTQITSQKADKALTFVFLKYTDFTDIFFKNSAAKLLEYIRINEHTIYLIKDH